MLGSLVNVDSTQQDPLVSLARFTLDEFLRSDTFRTYHTLSMFFVPVQHMLTVGISCAQYLSFSDFKEPCRTMQQLHERKSSYRLLEFAAKNWFSQLMSYGARGPKIKSLFPELRWFIEPCRSGNEQFISWQQVLHNQIDSSRLPTEPLFYATHFDMVNLFDILLEKGAHPESLYSKGFTVLQVAVIRGHEEQVAAILQTNSDLTAATVNGQTALHLAATYGHIGLLKLLLEAGASPHAQTESGSTPFYRAAQCGSIPAMELLYQAGSDVNAATWDGWTPIFEAIEKMDVPAIKWLISRDAKLNQQILHGASVLDFAKNTGNQIIIDLIESSLSGC